MGFVESVPPDNDDHDQSTRAVFTTTLYRDRSNDYGFVNRCGPQLTYYVGINDKVTNMFPYFEPQCFHHDKCY